MPICLVVNNKNIFALTPSCVTTGKFCQLLCCRHTILVPSDDFITLNLQFGRFFIIILQNILNIIIWNLPNHMIKVIKFAKFSISVGGRSRSAIYAKLCFETNTWFNKGDVTDLELVLLGHGHQIELHATDVLSVDFVYPVDSPPQVVTWLNADLLNHWDFQNCQVSCFWQDVLFLWDLSCLSCFLGICPVLLYFSTSWQSENEVHFFEAVIFFRFYQK